MRIFGYDIVRAKAASPPAGLSSVGERGWFSLVREPFLGAWQRGIVRTRENVLTFHAVYSCVTLIASDVAKCCIGIVEEDENGIDIPVTIAAFTPVLRKPNRYQNRIKFFEQWIISKLLFGNTYVLKERDRRGVVSAMYVLDPQRVRALVAPDGSVWYKCAPDNLAGIGEETTIPASEIIHDVMIPLYHPLCGVSPLTASGVAAIQGLTIQDKSTRFFQNGSNPGGVLTAPGVVDDATAARFKREWEERFAGEENVGRIAVLGNGLTYSAMSVSPVDAQLIEQLKWSAETVCSTFHVPAYKVGVGAPPAYNNIEALEQQYYSQCLQKFFECIELCLDEGLGLVDAGYGSEFDLDDLLRMDTATLVESEKNAVSGGIKAPNESRRRLNLPPVAGGESPYLQQQNYSLEALAKRDAQADPFASRAPVAPAAPPSAPPAKSDDDVEMAALGQMAAWELRSALELAA